ncbi:hypothetical protein M7I_4193 [Glarea lozoyensis 74030]|uniref:Uncharacterized protein n=1 Tax=Glarea lozoyensis (strain ATCC 74030 / MF5533) TaxID=1104152 RepID=H0ENI8_GLAL7|nr:hypothetical protein M7I_4193 [Glarea lozoyensis 74030]
MLQSLTTTSSISHSQTINQPHLHPLLKSNSLKILLHPTIPLPKIPMHFLHPSIRTPRKLLI